MRLWLITLGLLAALALIEVVFRVRHRRRYGRPYHVSIRFRWDRSHVVPHPFLSFAYKRNEVIDRNQRLPYPLHPNVYQSFTEPLRLNNLGHFGADFSPAKPDRVIRIACLGASTTANNISDGTRDYTYPALLEERLNGELARRGDQRRVEVLNCGIGGWVSADILVNFSLNIVHLEPDYVLLYHGLNDLPLYLMEGLRTDYSHGRRNLGEMLHLIKRAHHLPKFRWWHSYEFARDRIFGTGNVRNDVGRMITTRKADIDKPWPALDIQQQNIRSLLAICRHHRIRPLLATFAQYAYNDAPMTLKYFDGVRRENDKLRELAAEFECRLVDIAAMMPADREHFLDGCHFTPAGMRKMAEFFGDAVLTDLAAPRG